MKQIVSIFLCFMFSCIMAKAQSGMTDNQVMDYVIEQNAAGVSRQKIVMQLMQRGVTMDQIRRIQKKYLRQIKEGKVLGTDDVATGSMDIQTRMRKANGEMRTDQKERERRNVSRYRTRDGRPKTKKNTYDFNDEEYLAFDNAVDFMMPDSLRYMYYDDYYYDEDEEEGGRKIFGHDIFNNESMTFESSMNIATPQNYRLGAGDEVNIDIWGASQESITEIISPDGTITIEGIGVVQLGGLTVSQAKNRLRQVIGPRFHNSKIDLTLGQTRTITISITGEVKWPGTYTLSAFATVYNALYMAGGPNKIGTLRSVKVFREGRQISSVDIYAFLLDGILTGDVRLQDNDIITVGPYESLVCIDGKVKRPMYYEMKANESAATLLRYAGGFTGDAFTKSIRVNRKAGSQYSVFNVGEFDMNDFHMMDEDSVFVDSTIVRYQNMVEIAGGVFRPGRYQVGGHINTIKSLIEAAGGLTKEAIGQHAVMHRTRADRSMEVVSVDIKGILEGTTPDISIKNEDMLYVATNEEQEADKTITIHGEVFYPGVYKYAVNQTVEDAILLAGGVTSAASLAKVDVSRRIIDPKGTETSDTLAFTYSLNIDENFNINSANDFTLQPYDEIYVRRSPKYSEQQNITVEGEVQFKGNYTLTSSTQRLSDIIKQTGGLTKQAYPQGAKLLRQMTQEEREQMETMLRTAQRNSGSDTINVKKLLTMATFPVAIELDKALENPGSEDDIILRAGDRIVVPRYTSTVTINGEVLYPNTVRYKADEKVNYYLDLAGGVSSTGKRSRTIIIYMNGMVAKADRHHRPAPGCQIVVPTKRRGQGIRLAEFMSLGSSMASLATMLISINNLIK